MPSFWWSVVALGAAVLAQLAALLPVWGRWRQRRVAWLSDPAELMAAPRPAGLVQVVVMGLALVVVFAGMPSFGRGLTVYAFVLTGFACGTVASSQGVVAAGVAGLAFVAAGIVLAAVAWLPAPIDYVNVNVVLGFAAAGAHAGWLARFWRQQLLDGEAWTTTGRLIPAAAGIGLVCLVAAVAEGGRLWFFSTMPRPAWGTLPVVRAVLAGLLLWAAVAVGVRNVRDMLIGWRSAGSAG